MKDTNALESPATGLQVRLSIVAPIPTAYHATLRKLSKAGYDSEFDSTDCFLYLSGDDCRVKGRDGVTVRTTYSTDVCIDLGDITCSMSRLIRDYIPIVDIDPTGEFVYLVFELT